MRGCGRWIGVNTPEKGGGRGEKKLQPCGKATRTPQPPRPRQRLRDGCLQATSRVKVGLLEVVMPQKALRVENGERIH